MQPVQARALKCQLAFSAAMAHSAAGEFASAVRLLEGVLQEVPQCPAFGAGAQLQVRAAFHSGSWRWALHSSVALLLVKLPVVV